MHRMACRCTTLCAYSSKDETRSRRWDHKAPFVGRGGAIKMESCRPSGARQNGVYYNRRATRFSEYGSKALAAMALGVDPAAALLVPHRGVPLPTPEDFAGGAAILAHGELRFNGRLELDAARPRGTRALPERLARVPPHARAIAARPRAHPRSSAAGRRAFADSGRGNFLRMDRACFHAPDGGGRACV